MPSTIASPRRASNQPTTVRQRADSHAGAQPALFGLFLFAFLLLFFLDAI
jgi:hypothetical protein